MTSGSDDRNDDVTQHNPEWWEGTPEPGSPWQSKPNHPQQPPVAPADPTIVRGAYGPGQTPPGYGPSGPFPTQPPYPGGGYQSGPGPQQSGPMPQQSGQLPQQSGPMPQTGQTPYQSGPNPYQSGPNPYQSGPYQSGQPPFGPTGPQYGPPSGGGGNRKILLFGGIGLLVLVLVIVGAVVFVNRGSDDPPIAQPTTTSTSTTSVAPSTTKPTTTAPRSQNPTIPGYQVVVPKDIEAAWDVPSDWVQDKTSTEFSDGTETVPVAGLATEGSSYCTGFVRTNMFLSATQNADETASAREIGEKVARVGWSSGSGITSTAGEPLTNYDGTLQGVFMESTGTFTAPDPRCAKTFSVYSFAVSGGASSSLVLVIAADTGVDRAVDAAFAKRLLSTFRLI